MSESLRANRARDRVRQEVELVPLASAVFLWDHELNEAGEWPERGLVVTPHLIPGIDPHAFSSSTGADTEGWPRACYNNPAFVFGDLIFRKWTSEAERIEAVAEFAKIETLDWAREILRGITYKLGALEKNDDNSGYWREIRTIEDVERMRDACLDALGSRHEE